MQEAFRPIIGEILPNIKKMIEICRNSGIPVFWTQHGHQDLKKDGGFISKFWDEGKCIMWGEDNSKIVEELETLKSKEDVNIEGKTFYDAFKNTELLEELKRFHIGVPARSPRG